VFSFSLQFIIILFYFNYLTVLISIYGFSHFYPSDSFSHPPGAGSEQVAVWCSVTGWVYTMILSSWLKELQYAVLLLTVPAKNPQRFLGREHKSTAICPLDSTCKGKSRTRQYLNATRCYLCIGEPHQREAEAADLML